MSDRVLIKQLVSLPEDPPDTQRYLTVFIDGGELAYFESIITLEFLADSMIDYRDVLRQKVKRLRRERLELFML